MTSIEIMAHAIAERFARDGGFCGIEAGKEFAYGIRKALEEAGFAIVLVEPTEDQLTAARDWSIKKYGRGVGNDGAKGCYKAMLEAAKAKP